MKALTVFFQDIANVRIPIPFAMRYLTAKMKGESTSAELEGKLVEMRKAVSQPE